MEDVVMEHKIANDCMACDHVGYLPQMYFEKHGAHKFDRIFLRVVTDLHQTL
jgi:hypothetical protein